jgi:hypothetical protein
MTPTNKFDPARMQAIVDKLRTEGRLPSAEEFVRVAEELRQEVCPRLLEIVRKDAEQKNKVRCHRQD